MARHNEFGSWGEDAAEQYLRTHGYAIRERNWRFGHRDIDIVALTPDGITLVFVEVKTRAIDSVVDAVDAVDNNKMRNLCRASDAYVKQNGVDSELRFDIITVVGTNKDNFEIEHLEDAFNPLLLF